MFNCNFYLRQSLSFDLKSFYQNLQAYLQNLRYQPQKFLNETEALLAKKLHCKYCVLTSSMRQGLSSTLKFYQEKYPQKNHLLLPNYSFHSNLSVALGLNYKINYLPVDLNTLEIDFKQIRLKPQAHNLALIITHMHGLSYEPLAVKKFLKQQQLILIEDCAHIFEHSYLSQNQPETGAACFSFGAGKLITAFGGGAIASNDKELYQFLKNQQLPVEKKLFQDILVAVKMFAYTLANYPLIAFFSLKPLLAIKTLLKKDKREEENFSLQKILNKPFLPPNRFQINLINFQLKILWLKIKKEIVQRKKISQVYADYFDNNAGHFFQYPSWISKDQSALIIKEAWQNNLDLQLDYCSYLPKLHSSKGLKQAIFLTKDIIYWPTSAQLNKKILIKKLERIFS